MAKRNKIEKLENFIQESIENIRNDRAIASDLLYDLLAHIKESNDRHERSGPVAAKYLETLQRSNEQLVKITALLHKKNSSTANLTESDKNEIYDLIGGKK
jgi:adenine-specific DNA methylase